jgi:hypothetical protein
MDVDDDEDEPTTAPTDDNDDVATDGSDGDVFDLDDGPEE